MINRTYTLLNNLNEQLHFIDLETDNLVNKSEKALEICIESINKLKKLISKYNFKSQQEEILFFKEIKPQFNSKRIYYNTLSLSKGEATCDLSVKNPNKPEEAPLREPALILEEMQILDEETNEILGTLNELV